MAKKRILSWLAAASLALSLLPAAALAADGDTQPPSAQQTLEAVKEAATNATKAKEDAVEALGNTEDAKEKIEEIVKDLSSDNGAVDRVNETYDEGLEAETIVDAANEAIEEEAEKIDSDIDLSDSDAVSDAVNAKIDDADEKAQEALDAVVKADGADEEAKSLAQKAAEAVETAKNLAGSVTADSEQEAIKDAAEKAQNAADIARDAAEKAKEAVDSAESAYTEAINAAKEALEAAKNIDGALKDQENTTANVTVKATNEVTQWVQEMEPKADMTPEEQAARAAAEAGKAQTAANEAKTEKNLSAVTSVLDVNRDNLVVSKDTDVDAVKEEIDNAASKYMKNTQDAYDALFDIGQGNLGDVHPVIKSDIEKQDLPADKVIEFQEQLKNATTNVEKKAIAVAFGVNPARIPIDYLENFENAFLKNDLPRMLEARIKLLTAEEAAKNAKEAAEAVVDAQVAQQEADKAKSAADQAFEDYKTARAALIERERLNELHQQTIDLAALQNKLDAAEKKWQDAKDAADKAQKGADDAQDYADQITELIDDGTGDTGDTGDTGAGDDDGDDDATTIEDGIVPLALMPTRGELMNYLYIRAGSPTAAPSTFTDVPAGHEFAQAIGWAQAKGIAAAYEDGTFDPDNFVIAADLTVFLANYAKFSGMTVSFPLRAMASLEDDAIVENADEILAEFFGG